jgi:hypothetical protein
MSGEAIEDRSDDVRRLRRWGSLLEAPLRALDVRKVVLAVLGLALLWGGWAVLDAMFPGSRDVSPPGPVSWPLGLEGRTVRGWLEAASIVADPLRLVFEPLSAALRLGGGSARFVHAVLAFVWSLTVWGIFGCAIARVAAGQAVAGRAIGAWPALRFAARRAGTLLAAPLAPAAGIVLLALACAVFGLLYQIPGTAGRTAAGALAFLPLLAGLGMAFLLALLATAWPLMVVSIAAEAEDAFDALSRATSYVLHRPAAYALAVGGAWGLGTIGFVAVVVLARLALRLAAWGLALGAPDGLIAGYYERPLPAGPIALDQRLHAGWIALVALSAYGWAFAYVWTAAMMIYVPLRRDADGTALERLAP